MGQRFARGPRLCRIIYFLAIGGLFSSNLATSSTTQHSQFTPDTTLTASNRDVEQNNVTHETSSNSDDVNEQTTTPFLPDDINQLPCSVMREYGSWNFEYKYTKQQLRDLICRCAGICVRLTVPPEIQQEIDQVLYGPLSSRNRPTFIGVVTVYCMLFVLGMSGNVTTIIGLAKWMKNSTPTFAFIISLSCSDLLLLFVCMPLKVTEYFYLADIFTESTCKISYYMRDFTLVCSVLTLTVISFERYYAICHPLKVQYRCTWKRAKLMVLMTWIVSSALALPTIFMTKFYLPVGKLRHECIQQSENDLHLNLYFIYYLGVLFVVPMLIMLYTYGWSCYGLWKSAQRSQELQGKGRKLEGGNKKRTDIKQEDDCDLKTRLKVIKLLILVMVVFALCWGPSLMAQLLSVLDVIIRDQEKIRLGCETLTYFSSTLNPFIFMAMSSQFRKYICKCTRRVSRKRNGLHYQTTYKETTLSSSTHMTSTSAEDIHVYMRN